jgi:predicted metal-binding membrane protein
MALLFVGGVMNLGWILGLALFVLLEKTAPAGHRLGPAPRASCCCCRVAGEHRRGLRRFGLKTR